MSGFLEGGGSAEPPVRSIPRRRATQRTFFTAWPPQESSVLEAARHSAVTPTAPSRRTPGQPPGQPQGPRAWLSSNLHSTPGGRPGLTCRAHLLPSGRLSGFHSARDQPAPSWSPISMKSQGHSKQSPRLKPRREPGPPEPGEESWQGHPFSHQVVHLI